MKAKLLFYIGVVFSFFSSFSYSEDMYEQRLVCDTDSSDAFDFWIGEWQGEKFYSQYGNVSDALLGGNVHLKVRSLLNGCLIVEHAKVIPANNDSPTQLGFSARIFNPKTKRWDALLHWPDKNSVNPYLMVGRAYHDDRNFYRRLPKKEDLIVRYQFTDIDHDSFKWKAQVSSSKWGTITEEVPFAQVWFTDSYFMMQRKELDDSFEVNPKVCDAPEYHQYDSLQGFYTRENNNKESLKVSSILGGCALIFEYVHKVEGLTFNQRMDLMFFSTQDKKWLRYTVSDRRKEFKKESLMLDKNKFLGKDYFRIEFADNILCETTSVKSLCYNKNKTIN